ncbi:MAG: cytochrome c [Sulfuricurvum sp.]
MKLFLLSITTSMMLSAADGYGIYQNFCASCHAEMLSKEEVLKNINALKAPPMVEVSNRLKANIRIADNDNDIKRRVITAFIKDYIQNPDIMYSMCEPMALEKFGVMPSLKGKLSEEQRQSVAEWVYDRYENISFK